MKFIKKYKYAIIFAVCLAGMTIGWPEKGADAMLISLNDAQVILGVLPPVLVLIGLFGVWVPREVVIRYMGSGSGIKGIALAFVLGGIAAGPLFIAFPIAAMLAAKGARMANILFFIGIWTSAKLPMVLFEITFLGEIFTAVHVAVGVSLFLAGSYLIEKLIPDSTKDQLALMAGKKPSSTVKPMKK